MYGIWMPRLECSGYLAMAGLVAGGQADVVELLGSWGKEEEALLTNGLVLEVVQEYRGPGTLLALAWVLARVLGVQPGQVGYDLHQRFKLYFARTAELVARGEAAMDGPWVFLAKLRQGGSLAAGREYLWAPPPRYTAMVGRLQTMVTGEARRCNMCESNLLHIWLQILYGACKPPSMIESACQFFLLFLCGPLLLAPSEFGYTLYYILQGVSRHWTPQSLPKSQNFFHKSCIQ